MLPLLLKNKLIGNKVFYYPSLPSTMDVARRLARVGVAEGTVVLSKEQTAGRGRLGRSWLAPQGSLTLSVILHPSLSQLPSLIMISSIAVVHSVEEVTGLKSQIKWPNDVLFQGKKFCGILIENELYSNTVNSAIIGIGLNVNIDTSVYPDIASIATSLSTESGEEVPLDILMRSLLQEMERLYLADDSGNSVYKEWCHHLETLGRSVSIRSGDTLVEGYAESVDEDGSLWLHCPDGSLVHIIAGEVNFPSPASYQNYPL